MRPVKAQVTVAGGTPEPRLATRVGGIRARRARVPLSQPTKPADADQEPAPSAAPGQQALQDRVAALLRRHWLITVLAAAGLLLRLASELAYRPALIYVDSLKYLYGASPGSDPLGYKAVLLALGNLEAVVLLQHLLGIGVAVLIYALVLRRGASRWLAALAALPVLLDAYQVQMEQTIMPDVWFDAMIVAGLAFLLWRPALTAPFAAAGGLILGTSATVRDVGELLIVPALVYVIVAAGGWRRVIGLGGTLCLAFLLPILCYCSVSYLNTGHFWLARSQSTAGRLSAAADCATLKLPADVRPLCPTPGEQANGPDWLEHSNLSPLHTAAIPPEANRTALIDTLESAVEHQQPGRVAVAIARDSVRLFALTRDGVQSVTPIARWQFQGYYAVYPPWVNLGKNYAIIVGVQKQAFGTFSFRKLGRAHVDRPVAAFLRSYQLRGGYTPGPLFALFTLAGVIGSVLALLRRSGNPRTRQLALACLLFTVTAVTMLLVPDVLEFSWRYQLPALVTLPPAGVLGFSAILSARRARGESKGERVIEASDVAWVPGASAESPDST
jgi:hypothetical protein